MESKENEIEKVSISKAGLNALNQIRGLQEKAHYLVICGAKQASDGGWYLEGTSDAFDALSDDLAEEILYELSPPSRLPALRAVHRRIDPENAGIF